MNEGQNGVKNWWSDYDGEATLYLDTGDNQVVFVQDTAKRDTHPNAEPGDTRSAWRFDAIVNGERGWLWIGSKRLMRQLAYIRPLAGKQLTIHRQGRGVKTTYKVTFDGKTIDLADEAARQAMLP